MDWEYLFMNGIVPSICVAVVGMIIILALRTYEAEQLDKPPKSGKSEFPSSCRRTTRKPKKEKKK